MPPTIFERVSRVILLRILPQIHTGDLLRNIRIFPKTVLGIPLCNYLEIYPCIPQGCFKKEIPPDFIQNCLKLFRFDPEFYQE